MLHGRPLTLPALAAAPKQNRKSLLMPRGNEEHEEDLQRFHCVSSVSIVVEVLKKPPEICTEGADDVP